MTLSSVEVITSVERRRRWSRTEKERIVAASLEAGVSSSEIARSAGIHVSQLFRWRKELCDRVGSAAPPFLPVTIGPGSAPPSRAAEVATPKSARSQRRGTRGIIEIELSGGNRIRVDRDVDVETLRRILDVLGAR